MNSVRAWTVVMCGLVGANAAQGGSDDTHDFRDGQRLYDIHCVSCHSGALPEAPRQEALKLFAPEQIVTSLESGVMSTQGLPLSAEEKVQIAYYLTGQRATAQQVDLSGSMCTRAPRPLASATGNWTGWGGRAGGRRYQPNESHISTDNVAELTLKWAFGFPQATRARAQPVITDAAIYVGSQDGTVYSLDIHTGCIHWLFKADGEVRGSLQYRVDADGDNPRLYFGDFKASAYALDAQNGDLLWKTKVHTHPLATITGSVVADDDRVYVPVSSSEVVPASRPDYECCTFRGALAALDAGNGELLWRTYTTTEPTLTGKSRVGTRQFGPSGAPIWSTPTLDDKRNSVIVTTGQNYSSPATGTSDAIIAMNARTGAIRWVTQVTANDAWNGACVRQTPNCPEENGPDFDLGASPVMVTLDDGRDLILAGQKSGKVYALDPENYGRLLWQRRVGRGGTMGGVHWGMSSDQQRLYVGISDLPTNNRFAEGEPQPGLHALDPATGEFVWRRVLPYTCPGDLDFHCWQGISAAVSGSPGIVFAGGLDGQLSAFSASNGKRLWQFNTLRDFATTNGIPGRGGAIEADGPVIANGHLAVSSGYDKWGELPGNVLLVFTLPPEQLETP
ncbi:MAG: PQQ-binding-like beta-propeller repeat protein [Pseudomonadota bacterium]